jgi:hypothetical protein
MAKVAYNKNSPYYFAVGSTGKYLSVLDLPVIPKLASDVLYTLPSAYKWRPDLLAYDLYEDVNLWWVFSMRNPNVLKDPVFDMVPGIKIYIPKQSNITSILG